jgi:hypothetical protein
LRAITTSTYRLLNDLSSPGFHRSARPEFCIIADRHSRNASDCCSPNLAHAQKQSIRSRSGYRPLPAVFYLKPASRICHLRPANIPIIPLVLRARCPAGRAQAGGGKQPSSPKIIFTTVKITSSPSINSLLAPQPSEVVSADTRNPVTASRPAASRPPRDISPSSDQSVQHAAHRLITAAVGGGSGFEAGPRRADQPRMRSSIACARCRRSKVKCVNNGVNTTCRDCEAKGRECTYPTPTAGGGGGISRRESSASRPLAETAFSGEVCRLKRH